MFVTFEGTEGVGKSTLIREVESVLRKNGKDPLLTREPGGTPMSEKVRDLILAQKMDPMAELLLYSAARAEHVAEKIRPALQSGRVVLCDRFTDSSLAYQAHARGLPWQDVLRANELATQGLVPDLTILLDLDPEVGLNRATFHNRFEKEGLAFQKKVREGFLKAQKEVHPERWLRLEVADKTPEALAALVWERMNEPT